MEKYIHEVQITGKDEFAERFNYVSWLWQQACNPLNPPDKQNFYWEEHCTQKFNLEQGLPMSFLNEYEEVAIKK